MRNSQGQLVKGVLEAENQEWAIRTLVDNGCYILELERRSRPWIGWNLFTWRSVKNRDLAVFARQLGAMLGAGLPLLSALSILAQQVGNNQIQQAIMGLRRDVMKGLPLWEAMNGHRKVFSNLFICMVRSGELGGVLDEVLMHLTEYLEKEEKLANRLRTASVYPAMVAVFTLVVTFFLLGFIMPGILAVFEQGEAMLPLSTQFLLTLGNGLRENLIWILAVGGGLALIFQTLANASQGKMALDALILRLPLVGQINRQLMVARLARTLGILVKTGVPITEALAVTEDLVNNRVIAKAIAGARKNVMEGQSLSQPLTASGVFDFMTIQMIAVGEETGQLDEMLVKLSDYFETEVDYLYQTLMAMFEPGLILFLAVVIGFIVISTLLPLFRMMVLI